MKWLQRNVKTSMFLTLGFALMGLMWSSCSKIENIASETGVVFDTDLLTNFAMVQYIDATDPDVAPEGLKVEILGKDKDQVYSVLGEKNIETDGGNFVNLAVRKIVTVDEEDPLEFTIKVTAPGYLPSYRNVTIYELEDFQFITIPMVREATDAEGVAFKTASVEFGPQGTSEAVAFESRTPASSLQPIHVTIPAQTAAFAANGQKLQGEAVVHLGQFDPYNPMAMKAFPGELAVANFLNEEGFDVGPTGLRPMAFYALDMYVDGQEVKTFSQPITVRLPIDAQTINPATGNPVQVGDELAVASFDEEAAVWKQEQTVTVAADNLGRMYVQFEQPHLSYWFIGAVPAGCVYTLLRINSDIPKVADIFRTFYTELVDANTGQPVAQGRYFRFYNFERIFIFFPPAGDVKLRIWDGDEVCKDDMLYESPTFNTCAGSFFNPTDIDVGNSLRKEEWTEIFVEVSGVCPNGLTVRPTLPVLYKDPSCTAYSLLGNMKSGKGWTTKLRQGQYYDFAVIYAGLDRRINLQVPKQDTVINIVSPVYNFTETIVVDWVPGSNGVGQKLHLNYQNIQMPQLACDEYLMYFNPDGTPINPGNGN